jgi:hypothetical protein
MSDAVITVENLSKRYLIGYTSGTDVSYHYTALGDVLGQRLATLCARRSICFAGDRSFRATRS